MSKKVVAIIGSYRKGGIIDRAVEAILAGAREKGAETRMIYLVDRQLEFCTNCRECAQEPGVGRGKCALKDDLESLLTQIQTADALVLGSPVNYFNVTALFRRFMERTLGYAYWPWRSTAPRARTRRQPRKAVLVASAAMPAISSRSGAASKISPPPSPAAKARSSSPPTSATGNSAASSSP